MPYLLLKQNNVFIVFNSINKQIHSICSSEIEATNKIIYLSQTYYFG